MEKRDLFLPVCVPSLSASPERALSPWKQQYFPTVGVAFTMQLPQQSQNQTTAPLPQPEHQHQLDLGHHTTDPRGWDPKAASPRHGLLIFVYIVLFPVWVEGLQKASIFHVVIGFHFVVTSFTSQGFTKGS